MHKSKIKKIAVTAIFTAIIAASSWISIFTPFGVNLTLQLFGVCLAGFYLGTKWGVVATAVYITVGASGLPVFSFTPISTSVAPPREFLANGLNNPLSFFSQYLHIVKSFNGSYVRYSTTTTIR